jgi:hypothetical protein
VIDSDNFMGSAYALAMFVTSYLAIGAGSNLQPLGKVPVPWEEAQRSHVPLAAAES